MGLPPTIGIQAVWASSGADCVPYLYWKAMHGGMVDALQARSSTGPCARELEACDRLLSFTLLGQEDRPVPKLGSVEVMSLFWSLRLGIGWSFLEPDRRARKVASCGSCTLVETFSPEKDCGGRSLPSWGRSSPLSEVCGTAFLRTTPRAGALGGVGGGTFPHQ